MPRTRRLAPGGMAFHVLNRRVARLPIFEHDEDYAAFQRVVEETLRIAPIRICAFCWLPNHWHFVLWPRCDGDLSEFMQRMGNMHTQRWERAKRKVGYGHLYQGRFKSFPIESDDHFYRWYATWSVMPFAPTWSPVLRSGGGAVCGDALPASAIRCWRNGRCRSPRTGACRSINRKPRPSWKPSVGACVAGARTAELRGPKARRSTLDYTRRAGRAVARRGSTSIHCPYWLCCPIHAPVPFSGSGG
jgi:REP element-mobilizing transposase RayT